MSAQIQPIVSVKQVVVEYENGLRMVLREAESPGIGKLVFSLASKHGLEWRVERPHSVFHKIKDFFQI